MAGPVICFAKSPKIGSQVPALYFLTMVSSARRENMNSDIVRPPPPFPLPEKRKYVMFKNLSNPLTWNNDEQNNHCKSHSNTETLEVKLLLVTGNFIGVPDIILKIRQVEWGRTWWKIEFRRQKLDLAEDFRDTVSRFNLRFVKEEEHTTVQPLY